MQKTHAVVEVHLAFKKSENYKLECKFIKSKRAFS